MFARFSSSFMDMVHLILEAEVELADKYIIGWLANETPKSGRN
jgi:hypothetical protein